MTRKNHGGCKESGQERQTGSQGWGRIAGVQMGGSVWRKRQQQGSGAQGVERSLAQGKAHVEPGFLITGWREKAWQDSMDGGKERIRAYGGIGEWLLY